MKLAEALILRADKKKRIEQLKQRLIRNAKVQEGDKPAEAPDTLLAELEQITGELVQLIQRINRTNSATGVEPGVSLSDAIATRDVLSLKQALYRDLAHAATVVPDIRTKSEVRFKGTFSVADIQQSAEDLAKAERELDTTIQELYW
ncbi:MAG: DIP1984 family protein, partial [Anaerolineales bacterium]|nr:DIP1984 family protein [Anaerolineales bacterium]